MNASKITIAPATLKANKLTGKKLRLLKRKAIVEYIESKPSGEIIQLKDFMRVANFKGESHVQSFIKLMVRDGVIARYDGERPRTNYYTVLGKARTRKLEQTPAPTQDSFYETLLAKAKDFAWTTGNDSLREFVKQCGEQK